MIRCPDCGAESPEYIRVASIGQYAKKVYFCNRCEEEPPKFCNEAGHKECQGEWEQQK